MVEEKKSNTHWKDHFQQFLFICCTQFPFYHHRKTPNGGKYKTTQESLRRVQGQSLTKTQTPSPYQSQPNKVSDPHPTSL